MTRIRVSRQSGTVARGFAAAVAALAGVAVFAETAGLIAQQAPATAANCAITGTITGIGTAAISPFVMLEGGGSSSGSARTGGIIMGGGESYWASATGAAKSCSSMPATWVKQSVASRSA